MVKTPWFGVAALALGVLMAGSGCTAAEAPDGPALAGTT
jgi:hypothetical protein